MLRPATMLGAREECRATTEEMVTLADAIAERPFPNPLFFACEPEDLPVFYGDHAFESEEIRNWKVHCGLPMFRFPSSVPYGTIVAKGVDNLWVPSKHFGVSHDLGGSLRMQPEMRKTGYAAACAAKIALARGLKAKDVPYAETSSPFSTRRDACGGARAANGRTSTTGGRSSPSRTTRSLRPCASTSRARRNGGRARPARRAGRRRSARPTPTGRRGNAA